MPSERTIRLTLLGEPTMRGRRDLAQHFFVSGYLTATMGGEAANAAGVAKELVDSNTTERLQLRRPRGRPRRVRFAEGVMSRRFPLHLVGQAFSMASFMPEINDLPEGLSATDVASQYGTAGDPRFQKQLDEIDQRIQLLPPYRTSTGGFRP